MHRDDLYTALTRTLEGRRLLSHPFYQRWSDGGLSHAELCAYASQYRHFERMLPSLLRSIAASSPSVEGREQALVNLQDEAGTSPTHAELFDGFAAALHAEHAAPTPGMQRLLDTYAAALHAGAGPAFAALWAYEEQAPEVTASKSHGLRTHYGMSAAQTTFWDVHAQVDVQHARWAVDALTTMASEPNQLAPWARAAADAWWDFLSEREALALAA